MVKYTFNLKLQNSTENYNYTLDLNPMQEDTPEQVFTPTLKENIRTTLQNLSLSAIKDQHLNNIIQTWIEDIREGYRFSSLTLNLRLLIEENIDKLQENGNQEPPKIINPDISNIEPQFGMLPPLNFV
ncbi:hypothetical protein [Sphaerospermopsis sp. LEGE 08334]|jgi:hypothetical protein|uniref:hypothetical protein n=1 Tax=Sphaerospermopsis sp. LEGE 08334 TaxID=1828651 RepID=UPI00187F3B04|nr:hypothetical protein [Sphaerospermopsis sp. LEGE 08334]MBE9055318.1 hypothetical protein [Sphaerospermopsis sp. LEGE 08334]